MYKKNKGKKILVTDAGRSSSIAIIRALGRAGYYVIAADGNPKSIGFRSRFVNETIVYPSPEFDSQGFIEFMLEILVDKEVDLIIPVTEIVIQPIARVRELFDKVTRVALPPNELLDIVTNKIKTIELAKKLNIPVPQTFVVDNPNEALKVAKNLNWPIVLKPTSSVRLSQTNKVETFEVTYAGSPEELIYLMERFEGRCSVLLQSYHAGTGYGVELLTYKGEPIAAFAHKRLREFPITGGASSYRESVKLDQRLYAYSLGLLREIGWTGLAMVEFKVNGADAVLMEINGRVWGSIPLAIASGVNFPLLLAQLFLEDYDLIMPQLNDSYKIGLRCRDLQRDLMWIACVIIQKQKYPFLKMPNRLQGLQALAGIFNPMSKFDLFSLDDPMPGFMELPRIFEKFQEKSRVIMPSICGYTVLCLQASS